VEKYCRAGQATDGNMAACALRVGYLRLQTHIHNVQHSLIFYYNNSFKKAPHRCALRTLPITTHISFSRSVQAAGCCSFPNKPPAVHLSVGRTLQSLLRDEANLCQSRICSTFWAALIGCYLFTCRAGY